MVGVGSVVVGGNHPVRIQSMTTTDTLDVEATARQTIELAEAGCEIVLITAPNVRAAQALGHIASEIRKAKIDDPPTCSGDVETSYGATFANQIKGLEMTPKTKCSLGQMTAQQMKIVKAAQTKLENAANAVANDLNILNNQNATLDQNMLNEIAQIQKDTKQFETVQKETQILKKDIVDVSGMEESSGLDMVSNNIQLVMWTALGAIAVIGTIKATK